MKKKVMALFLSALMVCGLAACGSSNEAGNGEIDVASGSGSEKSGGGDSGEIYNVDMQIVTWGTTPAGIEDVEAAINAITEPEIGVTVTLNPVPGYNLISESNLTISSGEKLDLMCILPYGGGLDSIANYTGKNMLLELDDLYAEYGQDIQNCIGDLIDIGYLDGKLYAVPPKTTIGGKKGFIAKTEILNELGIEIDEDKIYTLDELEEIFEKYKEKYSDGNYAIASFGSTAMFADFSGIEIDTLGGDASNGVLIGGGLSGDTTIKNLFASEEYANHVKRMREWYEKGYFSPDVATITDDLTSLMMTGKYFGSFGTITPGSLEAMETNVKADLTVIKLVDAYATTGAASLAMWAIPNTCENQEKTMQFLNLMYQDRELATDVDSILAVGLEGSSYEIVEKLEGSKAIVTYPEGVSSVDVPWIQLCPAYGDQSTVPQFEPLTSAYYDEIGSYNQNIIDAGRKSCVFGYTFNPESVSAQMAAVQSIVAQYEPILATGSVDPEEVLPEYLKALEDAGIDAVIAENQAQLNEWMELNQ